MKRYKKTYAIYHLTEKHTTFNLGKLKVHVSFTGGIVTKKGVTPATFTTGDPVVQLAIEQSADFKKGVVKLSAQYAMEGEVKVGKNPKVADMIKDAAAQQQEAPAPTPQAAPETPPVTAPETTIQEPATTVPAETGEAEEKQIEGTDGIGLEIVEVSCKDVAKAYLQDHFNENPAPLRRREDVQAVAAKYGIIFKFD